MAMDAKPRYLTPRRADELFGTVVARLTRAGLSVAGSRVLAVRGRTSGEWRTVPVNPMTVDGERYLVAPRGHTQWVRNMRAAGGGGGAGPRRSPRWSCRMRKSRRCCGSTCAGGPGRSAGSSPGSTRRPRTRSCSRSHRASRCSGSRPDPGWHRAIAVRCRWGLPSSTGTGDQFNASDARELWVDSSRSPLHSRAAVRARRPVVPRGSSVPVQLLRCSAPHRTGERDQCGAHLGGAFLLGPVPAVHAADATRGR
jgi:hypothetical protein